MLTTFAENLFSGLTSWAAAAVRRCGNARDDDSARRDGLSVLRRGKMHHPSSRKDSCREVTRCEAKHRSVGARRAMPAQANVERAAGNKRYGRDDG